MRKRLTGSALLALTVLATMAIGQPPPPPSTPKADVKKAEKKPADSTDAAIAAALANDPDVKMARAKIQLAEAELAKARLAVAQKVTALKAAVDLNKNAVEVAEIKFQNIQRLRGASNPVVSAGELLIEQLALQRAQAALAAAEAELKLLTGASLVGTSGAAPPTTHEAVESVLRFLTQNPPTDPLADALFLHAVRERNTVKGPIPDRIRAALDKPVKLGPRGQEVTFTQALEIFKKEAGLDVPVRGMLKDAALGLDVPVRGTLPAQAIIDPKNLNGVRQRPAAIDSEGEMLPVGAWLQLFEDNAIVQTNTGVIKYHFYVREYGLLVSSRESAPADAPTLTEFWKQKPAKEPKGEPAPNR
ncbi:hypothetical protein [Frigoriglobus tundricola]|uniref:Uncharacterized protein n=1 Tax=Frigoriglobus tundricola TaxID=2774151 RepID=A0A6M5YPF7_9BACT|nr:hypothetical protein [Frigoriglobus tundricola]QJW95949.1 hypothetical protein FTUN_3503 [Frigoriglobus tundricola]